MGGGGPSKTKTQQTPQPPAWVDILAQLGAGQTAAGLGKAPITDFMDPHIMPVVGPDAATLDALKYFQSIAGGGAMPGVLDAFNRLQKPMIEQSSMQAGLGRSGAMLDALAMGQASQIMPALQLQEQAAGAEAGLGDYLRQIAQQQAQAPFDDFMRRQAITESLLSGATGLLPSTIGQKQTQSTSNAGLWGWLLGVPSSSNK